MLWLPIQAVLEGLWLLRLSYGDKDKALFRVSRAVSVPGLVPSEAACDTRLVMFGTLLLQIVSAH